MRFDIAFQADQRPEAQHQLRQIPSAEQVDHPKLTAALVAYETARTAEREARQTHVQLEQELPAAEYKDELALADAREKNVKDPGDKHAIAHHKLIAQAKRDWGARKITLERAVQSVVAAFEQHGDDWEASLIEERDELRSAMSELLTGWERFWLQLQRNSANRAVARGGIGQNPSVFASSFRAPRIRDGNVVDVGDVLEGLRDLAKPEEPAREGENVEPGGDATRHRPLSRSPFAGAGSVSVPIGAQTDPEKVRAWQDADDAEARRAGEAMAESRRKERLARAGERHAEREAVREGERATAEAS